MHSLAQREETNGLATWIIVGLIAGVLASLLVGGSGYGIVGDLVIGMVGALVGGWLFSLLDVATPFGGIAGSIFVAFIGAIVLLVVLHAVRRRRYGTVHTGTTYVRRRPWYRRRFF